MQKPSFVSKALPVLGHLPEFQRNRFKLYQRGFHEFGSVFAIKLGPKKAAVIADPELAGKYFKETDKSLNLARAQAYFRKAIGDIGLVIDPESYVNERPMLYAPFTREKLLHYLEVFNYTVQLWLDQLGEEGTVDLSQEMPKVTQQVISRCILGHENHESIGKEFWTHFNTLARSLDPILPTGLPHPKNFRRARARKAIAKVLAPILKERRQHPDRYQDVLQDILTVPFKDGSKATDEQALANVMSMLLGGHESTANQTAWVIIHLLQHPNHLKKVLAELGVNLPYGQGITIKSMVQMPHLKWAIDESVRLQPSADQIFRMTDRELQMGQFIIPKNWTVILGVGILQRHPSYVSQPDAYDPLRFSHDRAEHRSHRNLICGFGGGVHKCAGMSFAQNEMMTIVGLLLQQFELELITENPVQIFGKGLAHPATTIVKYRRKDPSQVIPQEVQEEAAAAGCPHFQQRENGDGA